MAETIDIRELNERIERQSAVSYTHLDVYKRQMFHTQREEQKEPLI